MFLILKFTKKKNAAKDSSFLRVDRLKMKYFSCMYPLCRLRLSTHFMLARKKSILPHIALISFPSSYISVSFDNVGFLREELRKETTSFMQI